ncbi:YggS family pyridoxal phosphate-dependent enzyme [Oleomonas cavernae]|uniref:Pyridoxal phosphate homeostasis protein n=1 Tax=Oleomonas cavernae TaxID=2320859 RepID=A0A418WHC8_9PROT|nr:YggS family pyridoxal phosphate-dependent enzyme [Oleomonas cavernae]RJF89433.1 YggS family pyridoxal phosphate-dependent enzyme [Oleomonas cavernae]
MTLSDSAQTLADRLAHVEARMAKAARTAGRAPGETRLVAVSKTHDAATVAQAIAAGQRCFGENRVQEAQGKFPALKAQFPDLELHLIGPLQTNKAKDAVALFDVIESVDREKLAAAIAQASATLGRRPRCFIQVNTGEEPQKAGCLPGETDALVRLCRETYKLDLVGLMCIPPADDEPSLHFALLCKLAARNGLAELSMGMSGDYEVAIRLGATYVRVGSAIFGSRPPLQLGA